MSVPHAGRLGNDVIVLCASDIRLISSRWSENTTYLSIFFQRNTRTQKRSHSCPFPNTSKGSKPRLSYIFIHTSYSTIRSFTPHAPSQQTVRTQCSKIPRPGHTLGKTLNPSNCERANAAAILVMHCMQGRRVVLLRAYWTWVAGCGVRELMKVPTYIFYA